VWIYATNLRDSTLARDWSAVGIPPSLCCSCCRDMSRAMFSALILNCRGDYAFLKIDRPSTFREEGVTQKQRKCTLLLLARCHARHKN
jgi:hypothetical protein